MSDPFVDPQSDFVKAMDLVGRLCIIKPTGVEHDIPSKDPNGKPYNRVIADVHVLDGPVTDKFDTIPCVFPDLLLSGAALVPQLTKRNPAAGEGKLKPGGLIVGRMATQKGQFNRDMALLTPCPAGSPDRAKASAYWDEYSKTLDPFATSV